MPGHQHQHQHQHDHAPDEESRARRPMTGLDHDDLQPRGNAAAQDQMDVEGGGLRGALFRMLLGPAAPMADAAFSSLNAAIADQQAAEWWETYAAADEGERQQMAHQAWQEGSLRQKINALDTDAQVSPNGYRDELGEVLDYLQQFEMMRAAGMTWEEMTGTQRDHMVESARQRALAGRGDHDGELSDEELRQAHQEAVDEQDYLGEEDTSWWDGLTPQEQADWNRRGQEAIRAFVDFARGAHPELEIREDEIGVDIAGNSNSVAYVDGNGKCWIGRETVVAIERNPAYATSTIIHELRGHPEFDTGFSLSMELYDDAAEGMPGYTRPAWGTDERDDEWIRFEYFESEIGALMREHSFWVPSQDLDGNGTIEAHEHNPLGAPDELLDLLLANLAGQFAPELQGPFVTGLARRFEADPRVTEAASQMFAEACQRLLGVTV